MVESRGTLYVVATPIGNLEDLTRRAERVLGEVAYIYAEDTRRTRTLLTHIGVSTRARSLHAHNEQGRVGELLAALASGDSVALVSDAGTPVVSDPGERVVLAAAQAGYRVEALPGASAVMAALAVSGLPPLPFVFLGFLPKKSGARRECVAAYRDRPETLVLFESPQRLARTLGELNESLGPRRACVARELTKLHEEVARGSLSELAERFAEGVKGEVTLVVEGAEAGARDEALSDPELDERIRPLLAAGLGSREIASRLASESGRARRDVYARVVALREED